MRLRELFAARGEFVPAAVTAATKRTAAPPKKENEAAPEKAEKAEKGKDE